MAKDSREKPILSVRIDATLMEKIDRLVDRTGVGRAEIVERCLTVGLEDEEEFVRWLDHPIKGPLLNLLSHPKVLPTLIQLFGNGGGIDETQKAIAKNINDQRRSGKKKPRTA